MSESKAILKFTDDDAVVGRIPHNDESTSSPREPPAGCQQNKGAHNGQQQRDYRSMSSAMQRQKVHTFKNLEVTICPGLITLILWWNPADRISTSQVAQRLSRCSGTFEPAPLRALCVGAFPHIKPSGELHQKVLGLKMHEWTIKITLSNLNNICTKVCRLGFLNSLTIRVTLLLLPLPED